MIEKFHARGRLRVSSHHITKALETFRRLVEWTELSDRHFQLFHIHGSIHWNERSKIPQSSFVDSMAFDL